ncbi:MAG: FeS-binding protein [Armatimonadetes bacterium CG_4_10_14_3_um_filter_66_18]|nr:FeS-binding protein [Armatimonadota bacterium]OIP06620.1 MAG: FeS-binding protein [Armatimonadetes bacterium CG2_30_66_41]PIW17800.1 MAG: FeS-binding protein [Armatimonadetes bacterium CG17_big_fil_post_rev_8_21_14_2_50_66_6]PIX49779.1 MAG: FeS-binding protein [Armatimonadetes bacterium CG_4_8_14_3_um_filter_66_20]PIY46711.1 MAG: FeS-binding protein [Armatimonadetes bacterium CG_4_10_14_3_um_filter_66_18]PIZ33871.1 MAG: FeS-binding protein [Armatimonadetes bacterium CG_4_10_14_0_8_um_filter
MPTRRIHLDFPKDLVTEPLIWRVGREFEVMTNIRRANVDHESGWVDLGLEGDDEELERAIQFLKDNGVGVGPIERNVIE